MASRKAALPPKEEAAPLSNTDTHDLPTREVETVDLDALVRDGLVPPEPATSRNIEDLSQTMEAPSAPRLLIMDAAESCIAALGYEGATEAAIARAAMLPIEMYRSVFPDKLSLLRALHDRFCSQAVRTVNEASESAVFDGASAASCVERTVHALLDALIGCSALVRAALVSGDARILETQRRIVGSVATRASQTSEKLGARWAPHDVVFVCVLAMSIAHDAIITGGAAGTRDAGPLDAGGTELRERVSAAALAYLGSRTT